MNNKEKMEFSKFLVRISHKLSSTKTSVVKWKGRYFKIKELG